jgi:hypothetical protein
VSKKVAPAYSFKFLNELVVCSRDAMALQVGCWKTNPSKVSITPKIEEPIPSQETTYEAN